MGVDEVTPFWRVLRADGSLNPKYPGGIRLQSVFLEDEGHRIVMRGKASVVENFEQQLTDLI